LAQFLKEADVGLVPYRRDVFTDGILPTKLMEYVALGLPAIAARTPAIEEHFDETMVRFFTPDDPHDCARCILELYTSRDLREELVMNSDRFNQQFSWDRVSSEYVALVERLS
jgi:glycosyltransferase involved in cell wall biosynthesis